MTEGDFLPLFDHYRSMVYGLALSCTKSVQDAEQRAAFLDTRQDADNNTHDITFLKKSSAAREPFGIIFVYE